MRKAATNEQRMSLTGAELVGDADAMPGRPYRSVLKPHMELIRQHRRADKSWQEIADLLAREKGVQVTGRAVGKFFASMKRRTVWPLGMEPQPAPAPAPAATRSPSAAPEDEPGRGSRSRMFLHLAFIRSARQNGDSWRQIVEALQARGVTISHQALSKYFERTQARAARRLDETATAEPVQPTAAQAEPPTVRPPLPKPQPQEPSQGKPAGSLFFSTEKQPQRPLPPRDRLSRLDKPASGQEAQ